MYMDTPDGQKKVLELLELLGLNEWRNVGKSTEGGILSVSLPRLDREIYIYISCPSSAPIFLPPSTPRNLVNNFTLLGYISSCNIIRSPFRRFFCHPSSKMPLYNVRDLLASQLGFPHSHAKRTLLF